MSAGVDEMLSRSPMTIILVAVMTSVLLVSFGNSQSPDGPLPDAPVDLSASFNAGSIHLSWSPPTYTGASYIESYLIYRGEYPGSEVYYQETTSTEFDDTGIEGGRTYYYQVSARNSAGEGGRSYEVSVDTQPPTWTVSGRCTEEGSMDGISGTHITFDEQSPPYLSFETWTDNSGSYSKELPEGNYRARLEADGYRSEEDYFNVQGPMQRDFTLEKEGDDEGDEEKFNWTEILGIDEDEIKDFAMTAVIIVSSILLLIPITFLFIILFLLLIFIRLGKVRKEIRAKNEREGVFLSKRRRKKYERKMEESNASREKKEKSSPTTKKEEASAPSKKKKPTATVEEISKEED
ncbi:MAG: fibronectin type III domain-containing protein [Candidatus Thermoplasmatota archaeon]|nr:fibronectin type III domain-containing protein [Candidatus Thermoplasmatota archaeon]